MLDLHITVTWMTSNDIARIGASMFANPAEPRLPGWYLRAHKDAGYQDIVKYTPIPDALVEELAERIDCELGSNLRPTVEAENVLAQRQRDEHIKRLQERIEADRAALALLVHTK